jgi:hypothetical protein
MRNPDLRFALSGKLQVGQVQDRDALEIHARFPRDADLVGPIDLDVWRSQDPVHPAHREQVV